MPAFVSHYLLAAGVADRLKKMNPELKFSEAAYYYGAQGPDVLFFHKVWLTVTGGDNLGELGSALHSCNVSEFFAKAKEYIETRDCDKDVVTSYVYGLLSHYALDRNAHPLIYAIQKDFTERFRMEKCISFSVHNTIEFNIDTMLINRELGYADSRKFDASKILVKDEYIIDEMCKLLAYIVPLTVGHQAGVEDYREAFHQMITVEKVLHDPKGIKRCITDIIQKPFEKKLGPLLSSWIRQAHCDSRWDYMNLTHKEWAMVHAPERKSTASFLDLYNIAKEDVINLVTAFESPDPAKEIEALTDNMSYDTGLRYDAV